MTHRRGGVARPSDSGDERRRGWALRLQRDEAHRGVAAGLPEMA